MNISSLTKEKNNIVVISILLLMTLLPSTNLFFYLRIAVITVLFFFLEGEKKIYNIFLFWMVNIVLAVACVWLVEQSVAFNTVFHEISRVVYYALFVGICSRCKIQFDVLAKMCGALLLFHFAIQLTQYFHLGLVDHFIETYYLSGNSENLHYIQAVSDSYSFRSGSIFINPNVYVVYPYLCTGVFLQQYERKGNMSSLVFVVICLLSILLTGSRMGILTYACIVIWYLLFRGKRISTKMSKGKVLTLIVLLVVLFNWQSISQLFSDSRALQISEGLDSSFEVKIGGLQGYMEISSPLYWIFGSLGSTRVNVPIDMEFGYVFAWFGIIGYYWYVKFIRLIYRKNKSDFPTLCVIMVLAILLTAFGASSILNMNVFPFIAVLAFVNLSNGEIETQME